MLRELARELAVAEVSDAVLMAYVDGELDEAERAGVAAALANDASLRTRADRLRASRGHVQQAFDPVLREPVPQHLIDFVRDASHSPEGSEKVPLAPRIIPFGGAPGRRAEGRPRSSSPFRMAAGVALLLLAGAGGWLLHPSLSSTGIGAQTGGSAQGAAWSLALNSALEGVPSGDSLVIGDPRREAGSVKVVSTFRSQDQRYCRQYAIELEAKGRFDGLACRTLEGEWLVEHQARRISKPDSQAGLRPASGRARLGVEAAVDSLIDGGVLDQSEERQLIDSRWTAKLPQH